VRGALQARLGGAALRSWCLALVTCALVVAADQGTKALVRSAVSPKHRVDLILGFHIDLTTNTGLAFGFLGGGEGPVVLVTVAALALVVAWFAWNPNRPGLWLAVGLLAGGALGNLADRVRLDAVTDFIDPPLWPAFNLADVAITVGAVVLVLLSLAPSTEDGREPSPRRPSAPG
jgi:signal peptidase II